MFPSPAFSTRLIVVLVLAFSVAASALPHWLRASITSGRDTAARQRLGRAELAVIAPRFLEQTLVDRLQSAPDIGSAFRDAAPLIAVDGFATTEDGKTLVPRVAVYGVDDRFWGLNGVTAGGLADDGLLVSQSLADALHASAGATVMLTIARGEDAPGGTVHGRRHDLGRTLRVRLSSTSIGAPPALSPLAATNNVPTAFVPLALLQEEPEWRGRINAILLSTGPGRDRQVNTATVEAAIARHATLSDYGLNLRTDAATHSMLLESRTGLLDDDVVEAVTRAALDIGGLPTPVMTTLVDSIRLGDRSVPYSFVTSLELQAIAPDVHAEELDRPPIVLNDWTAKQLEASVGDVLDLEFPTWQHSGGLAMERAPFQVAGILPMAGATLQPSLTPPTPGISGRVAMRDWTPRVPFDLNRVRPVDDEYWKRFGTTPKAFVPPQVARALWRTGRGSASAVQIALADGASVQDAAQALADRLRGRIVPPMFGITVRDVAADARALAEVGGREVGELAGLVLPFVLACLVFATACAATASMGRRQAISIVAIGTLSGAVASPILTAVCQYVWARTAGNDSVPRMFTATAMTSTVPLLVSAATGCAAALALAWMPPLLSRRTVRAAAATVATLAIIAAALVMWTGRGGQAATDGTRRTASGGYALWVRTTLPLLDDPATRDGAAALGLSSLPDVHVMPFRVHDGGSATLQFPVGPAGLRIAAVRQAFIDEGRFTFTASLDRTDEERANPWLLLRREQRDRSDSATEEVSPVVPAITSARTLSALQRRLGDDLSVSVAGRTVRFRVVAALEDALFDGALLIADAPFMAWFPDAAGYHWLAIDAPRERVADVRAALATTASRLGGSIVDARDAARDVHSRAATGTWFAYALLGSACGLSLLTTRRAGALRP